MTTTSGQSALRLILTFLICTLLISCGGGGGENPTQQGSGAGVSYQLKWPVAKSVAKSVASVPAGVFTVRMSVSGPDMRTIIKDFLISEYPNGGSIYNVPAGNSRTITFQGLASNGDLIYQYAVSNVTLVPSVTRDLGLVTMTAVPVTALPAAPSGLSARAVSASQIHLAWVDNANNETGYQIERKTGVDGTYVLVDDTVLKNDNSYDDSTDLSASTAYYYRVRAVNGVGNSDYSNESNATTSTVAAPAGVYTISGTITSGEPPLAVAGVAVTRSGNGTTTTTTDGSGKYSFSGAQNGSYTLTPVKTGYTFTPVTWPVTVNGANLSAKNFVATNVTVAPPVPSGASATAVSADQINFAWVDTNNETGYKIERSTGTNGNFAQIATVAANVTVFNDTTVSASTTYYYRVRANNSNGDSGYSNEASATTPAHTYNISGTITGEGSALAGVTVTLSGDGSASTTTNSSGNYSFSGALDGSYKLTPSKDGYDFTPPALAITVNGAHLSSMNFVATANSAPSAPTELSATATSAIRIILAWRDNANNEAGYTIERKTGADGTYGPLAAVAANITTYQDDFPPTPSTTFYYRVMATNSKGTSGYTAEANTTTITVIAPMLVRVTGGTYIMGDTFGDGLANEKPLHQVTVGDFYIGKFEVTKGEWFAVMGGTDPLLSSDFPVVNVSWNDIQSFITELNRQSGKSYRLPTEAEWEYAAAVRIDGVKEKYSGGSDVNYVGDFSWYTVNSGGATHQVGTKQGNSRDIYDMSGNVFEWVSDWYGLYSGDSQTNPTGGGEIYNGSRISRGGGWQSLAPNERTTFRAFSVPDYRNPRIGFRLAILAP